MHFYPFAFYASGRFLLIRKIYLIGIIFFLSSACLSGVAAENIFPPYLSKEEQNSYWLDLEPFQFHERDGFMIEALAGDQRKKEPDFDIPIVVNEKVEEFIHYFQTTRRDRFVTWLARSGRYIPVMRKLLKENGLPEDLVFMAFIESGFDP